VTKPLDMELFLSGVLTGSHATRQRHIRQAKAMQTAIQQRWKRDNPWTWREKHMRWFIDQHLKTHAPLTRYYYVLTTRLINKRLGRNELRDPVYKASRHSQQLIDRRAKD